MSNVKRAVVGMLCVILLVCSFIAFTGFTSANAETSEYFSAEEYTNSDKLLNYDGTSSENETIFTFADEVHYSERAAFIPDLARVVPLQYLENGWVIFCFMLLLAINLFTWIAHHKNLYKLLGGEEHRTSIKRMINKKLKKQ